MRRLLIALIPLAFLASACDNPADPYAAKIDDFVISTDIIDEEIEAVRTSQSASEQLDGQLQTVGGLQPGGENTLSTQWTSNVLYTRILATLFEREVERLNIEVTAEHRAGAEASLRESPEQSASLDGFPESYRTYLIERQAQLQALLDHRSRPEAVKEYYDRNLTEFTEMCVRHILLSTNLPNAQELAGTARARVTGGEDFAAVANDYSAQQGGPADGGEVGCFPGSQLNQLVKPFADAMRTLEVNQISEPVETQFGFHIVQVTSRKQLTLEEATPQIQQTIADPSELLNNLLNAVEIKVNPKYGDFVEGNPVSGTPARVVPHQYTGLTPDPEDEGASSPDGLFGTQPQMQP